MMMMKKKKNGKQRWVYSDSSSLPSLGSDWSSSSSSGSCLLLRVDAIARALDFMCDQNDSFGGIGCPQRPNPGMYKSERGRIGEKKREKEIDKRSQKKTGAELEREEYYCNNKLWRWMEEGGVKAFFFFPF